MPNGPGFWFDPNNGQIHRVTTHNDWLLIPENQDKVALAAKERQVLATLDPATEIDEIRMVGVIHGLVRFREYRNRLSVQFFCDFSKCNNILNAIADVARKVTNHANPFLTIQNLLDDSTARLTLQELKEKLGERGVILESTETFEYNQRLRQKMSNLLL